MNNIYLLLIDNNKIFTNSKCINKYELALIKRKKYAKQSNILFNKQFYSRFLQNLFFEIIIQKHFPFFIRLIVLLIYLILC